MIKFYWKQSKNGILMIFITFAFALAPLSRVFTITSTKPGRSPSVKEPSKILSQSPRNVRDFGVKGDGKTDDFGENASLNLILV